MVEVPPHGSKAMSAKRRNSTLQRMKQSEIDFRTKTVYILVYSYDESLRIPKQKMAWKEASEIWERFINWSLNREVVFSEGRIQRKTSSGEVTVEISLVE